MTGGSSDDASRSEDQAGDVLKRQRRKRTIRFGALAVVIVLALYLLFGRSSETEVTTPKPPRVTVIVPGRTSVASIITGTGSLAAVRDMPVGVSGEGGAITQVLVDAGDRVRAGQVLARIDRSAQVEKASQMAANVRAARAQADLAQAQLSRAEALVERGFISQADIDQKRASRDAAQAQAALAEAQLREMRALIARLDIKAPAAGIVLERSVEPGQVVGPGSGPLFRIAKDGAVEMRARLAEQDIARLKIGMPAEVTPVGQERFVQGAVWLLSPIIDPQTRQGEARISLPSNAMIRPGGFARVKIMAGAADQPLLPESAIQSDASGSFVVVVDKDNKAQRKPVVIGEVSSAGVAIAQGLTGKEQVVLSAAAFLSDGETVEPVRAAAR